MGSHQIPGNVAAILLEVLHGDKNKVPMSLDHIAITFRAMDCMEHQYRGGGAVLTGGDASRLL
jgi:hypothetical protein